MKHLASLFLFFICFKTFAHPMPNSALVLDINSNSIACEVQLPLKELQFALDFDMADFNNEKLKIHSKALKAYLLNHFKIQDNTGSFYISQIESLDLLTTEQSGAEYQELVFKLVFQPKNKTVDNRTFTLLYDAITHQVVTHKTMVTLKTDWATGDIDEATTILGTIGLDIRSNTIKPFKVNLDEGSLWKGFKSMVALGMKHISEGLDHLLFLIVLLLAAPLLAVNNKWTKTATVKNSVFKMLRITLAFTVGHSITLIIGALNWFELPQQPVEVLIAVSILITAIHCIKPIFPKRETYIAVGFGLIHGLAFAAILSELNLDTGKFVLSLLGFNMGIEIMQLFIVLLVMPWLLLMSKDAVYYKIKNFGAFMAIILSLIWIVERVFGISNALTVFLSEMTKYAYWGIILLATFTLTFFGSKRLLR